MTRNLRAFGLGLLAVLAFGAIVASAAQAAGKFTTTGTRITGKQTTANVITIPGKGSTKCNEVNFEGEVLAGQEEMTLTPELNECKTFGIASFFESTGCDLKLKNATTDGATKEYLATVDVVGGCAQMDLLVPGASCQVTLIPKTGLEHVRLKNTPNGIEPQKSDVDMIATVTGISWEIHDYDPFEVGAKCAVGTGKGNNAKYEGEVTLTADNVIGGQVSLQVSD